MNHGPLSTTDVDAATTEGLDADAAATTAVLANTATTRVPNGLLTLPPLQAPRSGRHPNDHHAARTAEQHQCHRNRARPHLQHILSRFDPDRQRSTGIPSRSTLSTSSDSTPAHGSERLSPGPCRQTTAARAWLRIAAGDTDSQTRGRHVEDLAPPRRPDLDRSARRPNGFVRRSVAPDYRRRGDEEPNSRPSLAGRPAFLQDACRVWVRPRHRPRRRPSGSGETVSAPTSTFWAERPTPVP